MFKISGSDIKQIIKETLLEMFSDFAEKGQWIDVTKDILKQEPKLLKQLFVLIDKSYKNIGGNLKLSKPDDLLNYMSFFRAVDLDDDPYADAVKIGKTTPYGKKSIGMGTDGSALAKKEIINNTAELLNSKGYYAEMSDAIAHIMITRYKVKFVNDSELVKQIIQKPIEWVGENPNGKYPGYDGWYYRNIAGHKHLKILLGNPNT